MPRAQYDKDQEFLTRAYRKISATERAISAVYSQPEGLEIILHDGSKVVIPSEECSPHVVAVLIERVKLGAYSIIKTLIEDSSTTLRITTAGPRRQRQRFTTISQLIPEDC